MARGLLTEGRIIPVLDGLDEIFGGVDAGTVRAPNQAVVEIPGFLLTCRRVEFTAAASKATWPSPSPSDSPPGPRAPPAAHLVTLRARHSTDRG
ncbi:hypothetical protein [Streptosporangium sp. OZ121]|uniref:hypothetical protein n=1 Tax=Streptosporangium sp. OZ121 TaxID=3444183 RepID=UPI003F7938A7